MIISTTYLFLVQVAIVTWIAWTAPEPCPNSYIRGSSEMLHEHCEITPAGLGWQWSLRKENIEN